MKRLFANRSSWIILALVLLNVLVIAVTLLAPPKGPPGRAERMRVVERWQKSLDLSPAQDSAFRQLYTHHFARMDSLGANLREHKRAVVQALLQPQPDTLAASRQADQATAVHQAMEAELIRHFLELRGACTPEQQARLLQVFHKIVRPGPPPEGPLPR